MVSQACTINIWQLAVWCCSVWTFCAAAAYTRPVLGQLSGCCCGTVLGKEQWGGVATPARLTHAISFAWLHSNHLDPFWLWQPIGICLAVSTSWKERIWSGLEMPVVQSRRGCEQCIWWRLEEKLHGGMAVCFTQAAYCFLYFPFFFLSQWYIILDQIKIPCALLFFCTNTTKGCSPALSNMTSPTFTFRLKRSILKQCLPFSFVCFWKIISFPDYSLCAEYTYVTELDMCFKDHNCTQHNTIPYIQLRSHSQRKRVSHLQPHERPGFLLSL